MAVAGARLNDGDPGVLHHRADQALASAGNQYVHQSPHVHESRSPRAVGHGDQTDEIGGEAARNQRLFHGLNHSRGGADSLLATAKHHGVAGLETQSGGVHRHVGASLVDHGHAAHGGADVTDHQTVGAGRLLARADGIGQGSNLPQSGADARQPFLVQLQPIQHGLGNVVLGGGGQILGIGGQDGGLIGGQLIRHGQEQGVLLGGGGVAVGAGGFLGGAADGFNVGVDCRIFHFMFLLHT